MDAIGFDAYNQCLTGGVAMSIRAIRSDTEHLPCAVILLDHHPADSRTDIAEDQTAIQTLTSRMGTGGGNVPMILEPITFDGQQVTSPLHKDNTEGGGLPHIE